MAKTSEIHREDRRTGGREVFVVRRACGRASDGFGTKLPGRVATAPTQENLGLACPPVLPSSCEISSRAELPGSATIAFCELGCGAAARDAGGLMSYIGAVGKRD